MVDILTHVFSTYTARGGQARCEAGGPSAPCSALVLGGPGPTRSVLLLAALTAASRRGMKVWFFTQTQIQTLPPSVQSCLPHLRPDSLKMIRFCYPRSLDELLLQVAGLHEPANTAPPAPSLIIVDRLQNFLCGPGGGGVSPGEMLSRAAHLSALMLDTAAFLSEVLELRTPGTPCRLLASFQQEPGPAGAAPPHPVLAVLDRYFPVRFTLERDGSYAAAAAGLEELWRVELSGAGSEDQTPREWQLVVFTDGLMEFRSVEKRA